jgi:L-fuconolactonase
MPIADAHLHLFARGFSPGDANVADSELAVYERLRNQHKIERGLVIGYEGEERHRGNNEYILALGKNHPWVAPVAYLDASPPPSVESLRHLHRGGARGFSVYAPDGQSAGTISTWPVDLLAELNDQNAIVSINAPPAAAEVLAPFVRALDECTVLFSHLGLPGRFRAIPSADAASGLMAPLLRLAGARQVAVKFSGLYGVSDPAHDFPHRAAQPFVEALLDAFGPSRILWGSDFSPALEHVSFVQTLDPRFLAGCTSSEIAAVMGGNLLCLLEAHEANHP